MRSNLVFLIFLFVISVPVFAQWQNITPFGGNINDVYFLNARDGIAVGQQAGIGSCSAPCYISRTIDGGQNWFRIFPTGLSTTTLNALDFSGNTGLACGSSSVILKTTDAGYTWTQPSAGVGSGYNDIAFTGANAAVVIGNNGLIRYSSNAGSSWSTVASGVSVTLNSLSVPGNGIVYIGGSNGTLLKSTNSGNSWSSINTGITNSIFRLCFITPQEGYFAGGNTIFKTTNGGTSWTSQVLSMNGFIRKIRFRNPQYGYFVTDAGEWGITSDSGATWSIQHTGYLQALYSFRFIDPMNIVACGDEGILLRSEDGGSSWHSQISGITDEQFGLLIQDTAIVWACGKDGSVFRSQNAGFNWQRIKTGTTGVFFNISRISAGKVILCADSGRVFLGDNHHFDLEEVFVDSVQGIKDAWFIDTLNGWACSSGPDVYRTTDGGHSWTYLSSVSSGEFLRSIQFVNDSVGFVAGGTGVYKTNNAGLTWTYTPFLNASSIDDIRFYGDSVGYCAGSFGKMMKTMDQGNFWFESNPSMSGNINVSSISLINDSTVYIASNQSQRLSINGGENFGSQSTACLANNWSTNAIDVIAPDTIGFCTGGISGLMHKLSYNGLNAVVTDRDAYCSNESIEVFFRGSGLAFNNWIFNVELSDASGNFSNPVIIGTSVFNQLNYLVSGLLSCPIPAGTPAGSGYRVRVVCTNPLLVSPDNGYDIAIANSHIPALSLSGGTQGCEGNPLDYTLQSFAGGSNPQWSWYLNDTLVQQGGTYFQLSSPQAGDYLYASMNSSLQCAAPTLVFSDTVSPVLLSPPILQAGNDTTVCAGSLVQLSAQSAQPLLWFPQGLLSSDTLANPLFEANQSTTFIVRSGTSGCESADTVMINVLALPQANIGAYAAICSGSCLQLAPVLTDTTLSINWTPPVLFDNPVSVSPIACLLSDTWIFLAVTDSNTCTFTDSSFVEVYAPLSNPVVIQQGDTLITNGYISYQWQLNGQNLAGATDSIFVVQQTGLYSVVATDSNGCSAQSDTFFVVITGVNQESMHEFSIYPVPANHFLQVHTIQQAGAVELCLYSSAGILIRKYTNLLLPAQLDLNNLSDGLYLLEITSAGKIGRRHFIKTMQ